MNLLKVYVIIPLLILLSCGNPSVQKTRAALTDSIPEGAVPFEYDFKLKRAILIPGTLNDSIHLKYFFETGCQNMAFSDNLASDIELKGDKQQFHQIQKTMKVRIGGWERSSGDSFNAYYLDKKDSLFWFLGSDMGILPWKFFDQKIIEISFSKQYIKELSNTRDLQGYDSVKMEIQNGLLGIPVVVSIQGKKIKEFVTIDTGCNSGINFGSRIISKYGIKSDNAMLGEAHLVNGIHKQFFMKNYTIQIGNHFLTQKNYASVAFTPDQERPFPFSGLIGTRTLEKFDMVLDLKNYCLYLKPVDKDLLSL